MLIRLYFRINFRDPRKRPEFIEIINMLGAITLFVFCYWILINTFLDPFLQMNELQFLYNVDLPRLLFDLDSPDPTTRLIATSEVFKNIIYMLFDSLFNIISFDHKIGCLARKAMYPCEICASRNKHISVLKPQHLHHVINDIAGSLICTISVPMTPGIIFILIH